MINLQISESISPSIDLQLLEKAAKETLLYTRSSPEGEITLVLTDDAQIQQLNRDFLEIDAPTDVLAFPADYTDPDTEADYLGDVIISWPRAEEQSRSAGHPVEAELQLLVIHGVLHLLGYDHADDDEKVEMWALQGEVLDRLGLDSSNMPQ